MQSHCLKNQLFKHIHLKHKKFKNLVLEKNVNTKRKSVSGIYILLLFINFLTNDKPAIKIVQYRIIFLVFILAKNIFLILI